MLCSWGDGGCKRLYEGVVGGGSGGDKGNVGGGAVAGGREYYPRLKIADNGHNIKMFLFCLIGCHHNYNGQAQLYNVHATIHRLQ